MKGKKLLAVAVSIALLSASFGEAGFTGSSNLPLLLQEFLTAIAADGSVTFDEASGVLTLHGAVTKDMIVAYRLNEAVTSVVAEAGTILPSNCWRLFYGGITYISADNKWTSEYWKNLTSIDLSQCDTSNVTDMSDMFAHCCALTSLDLSNSDTSKVQDMSRMFSECYALTSLDISSFDTSNVTDMSGMFSKCYALTSLDVSSFDTSNVTDMSGMFSKCYALTSLDLSNSDTSKVQDMSRMFSECYALTSLDLRSFDTSNITDKDTYMGMRCMFCNCSALETIYTSYSWADLSESLAYSYLMLKNAANLVGGNGTVYDAKAYSETNGYNDLIYAWIDSDDHPGYFTYKEASVTTPLTTTAFTETKKVALYGDTTQDGVFDISDVVLACRFMVGDATATIKDAGIASSDVNGDGQVTSYDTTLMLKEIAKKITDFPAEETNE